MDASLSEKLARVERQLATYRRVLVAFSGGVDSTLLAKLARDVLGKSQAPAVTADSPSLARADLDDAKQLARTLDLEHLILPTDEVRDPAYRLNTPARCYFCKGELFSELGHLAAARGVSHLLYGAIGDDRASERPGQRAATERGIHAPLQEAGLAKWEIREAAHALGLPNWNRPQNACLSSRIPHGLEVTEEKLSQIERAEAVLLERGFRQVRVRHLGTHARIEVGTEEVARFDDAALCEAVVLGLRAIGFASIGVDPAGYRAGGADALSQERRLL